MFNKYNSPENQIIDTCQPVILVHEPFPHPHASGISSWHNQHTRIFKISFNPALYRIWLKKQKTTTTTTTTFIRR